MRWLSFLAVMLLGGSVLAQTAPYTNAKIDNDKLSSVALNASAGTRTITENLYRAGVQQPAYSKARLVIAYTYSAATTVTVAFKCSLDGTNYGQVMARSVSGSTATVSTLTDSYTTGAASANLMLEYDVRGCLAAQWLFGGASAGANDKVTVDVALIAGL
jgi:hypothetical protein